MPRYEKLAYITADVETEKEAEQLFSAIDGELVGDGLLLSFDESPMIELSEDGL